MTMNYVINLHGLDFVTGLFWQNLTETSSSKIRKEIVRAGKDDDCDLVCIPSIKNPIQAGYMRRTGLASHKKIRGFRSLAGALAETNPGSWLGMFEVESDLFYFIAVHNDHILAYSDIVGDRETIQKKLEHTLSSGGWQYVVATEGFEYAGATIQHVELADMAVKRAPKIKPLEYKFQDLPVKQLFAGALLVGAGYFVWTEYVAWDQEQEREAFAQRKLQEELARKKKEQVIPPWTTAVPVERFLSTCEQQFHNVHLSIMGWQLLSWSCDNNQVTASYEKQSLASTLSFMDAMSGMSLSQDGLKGSQNTPVKMAATGSLPAIRTQRAKAALMDYAALHDLKINFQPVPVQQPMPGKDAPPPPPWTSEKISIESNYPVFQLVGLTAPGLILKRLETTRDKDSWHWKIEGELYVAI